MMTTEQIAFLRQWAKALRSKNYDQGQKALCYKGKYCCLGVAVEELYGEDGWEVVSFGNPESLAHEQNQSSMILSFSTTTDLGLSQDTLSFLMKTNDDMGWSFDRIADYIDELAAGSERV